MRGRDAPWLLIFLLVSGCFKTPDRRVMASLEISKKCMDGGGTVDLTNGECQCARGLPWDEEEGHCYGFTPRSENIGAEDPAPTGQPTQDGVIPEEHKAVYAALPKDTIRPSEGEPNDTTRPLEEQPVEAKGSVPTSRPLLGPPGPSVSTPSDSTPSTSPPPPSPPPPSPPPPSPPPPSPPPPSPPPPSPPPPSPPPPAPPPPSPPPPAPPTSPSVPVKTAKMTRAGRLAALKATCQDNANGGMWEAAQKRCQCPKGHLWLSQRCVPLGRLTSRQICTSDFHRGQWDISRKACLCRPGFLWIDQQCESIKRISDVRACRSEFNGGSWSKNKGTCQCPAGRSWSGTTKRCL